MIVKKQWRLWKKLFTLLPPRQKAGFGAILLILAVSAVLSQVTPLAVGYLTDSVLTSETIAVSSVIPILLVILLVNVVNEVIKVVRRLIVEDTATQTEKTARQKATDSLLLAPLSYFREHMTGNIHGRLNRSLEGTVKLIKLLFMDFAPAITTGLAAIVTIFVQLPAGVACLVILVIPIGTFLVFRQISTQKGIRVELLETKAAMDGSIVELLNGIEVIRIIDSVSLEQARFDRKSEFLRAKEMRHHVQMAKYDCLKFLNEAVFTVLMIGVSAYLATQNVISTGAVLTSYLCFNQLLKPLEELHRILDELSESMVLAEDYFRLAEIPCDFSFLPVESAQSAPATPPETAIELRQLCFAYHPDKVILHDLDLSIPHGMFLGIAIARIFLRKPDILILDEATSALDNTSERLIQSAIEQLMKETGMTVLSIAHRLTTLKNADRIIVMDGGRIVQSGTYGELIEQHGIFSDMYHGKLK